MGAISSINFKRQDYLRHKKLFSYFDANLLYLRIFASAAKDPKDYLNFLI